MMGEFGKFALVEYLGGGKLSEVYLASTQHAVPVLRPTTVLKRVSPAMIGEPRFVNLIVREAKLLTQLTHPGLCQCHELGVVDGSAFLTLDRVEGCTLRAVMRRCGQKRLELPTSLVLRIATDLADILDYLHRRSPVPLIHLDLSPQNVMVTHRGEVRLIDFGIARLLSEAGISPLGDSLAGTVGYMSPEQARGDEELGVRADQFGVGILLWELSHGRRLYTGSRESLWAQMSSGRPAGRLCRLGRPGDLEPIVTRLLSPAPEDRFASMEHVQAELAALERSSQVGRAPLAALVTNFLSDPNFDPFDRVRRAPLPAFEDIGDGHFFVEEDMGVGVDPEPYHELRIEVDHESGDSAARALRAAIAEDAVH